MSPRPTRSAATSIARDKGLPGEVITGGEDPAAGEGLREEQYYGRLLSRWC